MCSPGVALARRRCADELSRRAIPIAFRIVWGWRRLRSARPPMGRGHETAVTTDGMKRAARSQERSLAKSAERRPKRWSARPAVAAEAPPRYHELRLNTLPMTSRADRPSLLSALSTRGLQFLRHLTQFARLYWRLLCDRRVSMWPRALLV